MKVMLSIPLPMANQRVGFFIVPEAMTYAEWVRLQGIIAAYQPYVVVEGPVNVVHA